MNRAGWPRHEGERRMHVQAAGRMPMEPCKIQSKMGRAHGSKPSKGMQVPGPACSPDRVRERQARLPTDTEQERKHTHTQN
eukprot:scaffold15965_cov111-Isochrysis_galbana.AAC.1